MNITSSEAKSRFGEVMQTARREPVTVLKSGKPAVAILDIAEYQRLLSIENDHWAALADKAKQSGMVGTNASLRQLTDLLHDDTA